MDGRMIYVLFLKEINTALKFRIKNELVCISILIAISGIAQPDWEGIKVNPTFTVSDATYGQPRIQSINVPGWEDGLYLFFQ